MRNLNWLRLLAILGGGATLLAVLIAYGKLDFGWVIPNASAGEVEITWTKPERNCDGTPLTNLAGFRAYWWPNMAELANPAASAFTIPGLAPGRWWVSVTAYNSAGEESYFAGPAYKDVLPADFKTVAPTVYTVVKAVDRFVLLPVGTVPLGVVCDATNSVNGSYVIPRTSVVWSGSVKPDVVVAKCG